MKLHGNRYISVCLYLIFQHQSVWPDYAAIACDLISFFRCFDCGWHIFIGMPFGCVSVSQLHSRNVSEKCAPTYRRCNGSERNVWCAGEKPAHWHRSPNAKKSSPFHDCRICTHMHAQTAATKFHHSTLFTRRLCKQMCERVHKCVRQWNTINFRMQSPSDRLSLYSIRK